MWLLKASRRYAIRCISDIVGTARPDPTRDTVKSCQTPHAIRDGVILSLNRDMLRPRARRTSRVGWSCDHDEVVSLFDADHGRLRAP